jgi:CARDB
MRPPSKRTILAVLLSPLLGVAAAARAEAPKPALTLEAVKVEPASPRPDTLCHLTVTVKNAGTQRASSLEFVVKINGQELPAYRKRLYLIPVEPGATREVRLFNFWSTETGRPTPANGKLNVEVTLARASWVQKASRDGAEVWTPAGEVAGLPASRNVTLTMAK